jgi:LmbE family N-acetylglucosaminyl deacetylase
VYFKLSDLFIEATILVVIPILQSRIARILIIVLISIVCFSFFYDNHVNASNYPDLPAFKHSDKILVFAPHPDDETLGTAGVIKKALEKNATVLVVVVTDGSDETNSKKLSSFKKQTHNHNKINLVEIRHQETLNAMKKLGLKQSNIIFLGYPDAGLKVMFEDDWDPSHPYRSNNSFNHFDHSPYNYSYQKNAPYTGYNLNKNMEQILTDYKPDIIFYPDGEDAHLDHWATNAFVMYAMAETNYTGKEYTYLVHGGKNWPSMYFYPLNNNLFPPQALKNHDTTWIIAPLNDTEKKAKQNAINSYPLFIYLYGYPNSFIRSNELFAVHVPLKIEKVNKTDFFQKTMPISSFKNVEVDPKTTILGQPADLSTIGLFYDKQNLYLLLKNTKNINKYLVYYFHFRIYNGQEFKRIDIKVTNGKAEYQEKATNSIKPDNASIQTQEKLMTISIPLNYFQRASFIMFNSEVYNHQNKQLLDITPMKELKL